MIKFRTMTYGKDAAGELLPDDKRLKKSYKRVELAESEKLPLGYWSFFRMGKEIGLNGKINVLHIRKYFRGLKGE